MLKVACVSIGFPNFRYDIAEENLHKTLSFLRTQPDIELYANDRVLITEPDIAAALDVMSLKAPDLFILELGTYSYGSALMMYLEKIKGAELVMWSFREPILSDFEGMPLNSLCALNMYTSFLKRMGKQNFSYLYGGAEEPAALNRMGTIIKAAQIKKELRRAKFCIVGGRVPGFYLSNVDELRFRDEIGPEIIYYSVACLVNDAEKIPQAEVDEEVENFRKMVSACSADEKSMQSSARIYIALRSYARENGVTGFALKCWPDFQEILDVAVCGVVARLNEEGLMSSCEGDVTGLSTMFIQRRLSVKPVFLTDLVNITESGTVKLWHCGSAAPSLAADKKCCTFTGHPTMKHIKGVASQLDLMQGSVTICKLSEDKPYKLLAAEGSCIAPDRTLTGNQGDIRFGFDSDRLLDLVVNEGIEHHYSIAYDCDMAVIKQLASMMGIRLLTIE